MIELSTHPEGTVVSVRALPGSRRNEVVGEHAGALKVAVSVAPEKGKANAAIAEVLAETIGLRAAQVVIVSGDARRDKRYLIVGLKPVDVEARLRAILPN